MTTRRHYCDDEIFTFCDDVFENTLVLLFVEVYVLVDVLPFTAGVSSESIIVMSLLAAGVVVIASRMAVAAYRHFTLK